MASHQILISLSISLSPVLMRHLPNHMPSNSTYSLFPFFTPEAVKKNLGLLRDAGKIPKDAKYDFGRPHIGSIPRPIHTLTGIRNVSNDPERFPATYRDDLKLLNKDYGSFWVSEDALGHDKDKAMVSAIQSARW